MYCCKNCGTSFTRKAKRGNKPKFCCEKCRRQWWIDNPEETNKVSHDKLCEECGEIFSTTNKKQRFCSAICRVNSRTTLKNTTRQCLHCKESFIPKTKVQKYCSIACVGLSQKKWYSCKNCGCEFNLTSGGKGIFCSRDCNFEFLNKNKKSPKLAEKILICCDICSENFEGYKNKNTKTCSDECRKEYTKEYNRLKARENFVSAKEINPFVKKKCPECGCIFKTNYLAERRKFCSKHCSERYSSKIYKEQRKEQIRKAYVEPVSFIRIYRRDKAICQICGEFVENDKTPTNPMGATIDHIVPLSKGGLHSMSNCQLAHRRCNSLKGDKLDYIIENGLDRAVGVELS